MIKSILVLVSFLFLCLGPATKLSTKERAYAQAQLADSQNHLSQAIRGLSENQLNFKPSEDSWSIAACTEHIAISEGAIFGMVYNCLGQPADPSRRSEVKLSDEQVVNMITDRTNKVKTSEAFEPTGKFGAHPGAFNEFVTKREAHIKYINSTDDDLRNRYQVLPFGVIDAYQVILFMAAHSERHTRQIEAIRAHPDFPNR